MSLYATFCRCPAVLLFRWFSPPNKKQSAQQQRASTSMEAPDLEKAVQEQDWEKASHILNDHPELAKEALSSNEFLILWWHAPLETIRALLQAWPEAYKEPGYNADLVIVKSFEKQWDFLDKIFQEFPQVLEMKYAGTAAKYGAPLGFLNKHWKETGVLLHSVHSKDWEKFGETLNDNLQLVKEKLYVNEYYILWKDAPLETIQVLLAVWPEAYEMEDDDEFDLVKTKIRAQQWDFLKSILPSCPNSIIAKNMYSACEKDVPIDLFQLMLEQQPDAPVEEPSITFKLIEKNKLEHFLAVLDRHPTITERKDVCLHLTPLLLMFQEKEKLNADWIGPLLKANPNAAKQKDFDGKTPLHLAYQHGASSGLIDMIQQAYPEAENERDNLGRFPKDLSNQSEKDAFTAANKMLILRDNLHIETSYADDAVVVCRGDMLMRDPQLGESEQDKETYENYSEQVAARHGIFETLLEEFSKMVGIEDKDVIQKAAAIQAILAHYLSNQGDSIINFELFENPGYWLQQEILKLVMRVFCETQHQLREYFPSIGRDAEFCMNYLNDRKNGEPSPEPSKEHFKAYNELTQWLTEGLDKSSYTLQGPVLKPLQSLFNKLFIRRGQTSVSVIGDMVRGTLLLDNMTMLDDVVKQINDTFPNITENQFQHPESCNGLADFLTYVHDDLKILPGSNDVLPYRFKANSSQKEKEKPLWFNLNFFLQVPEYHRVGLSEMFVACELQIGLSEEINKHRSVHVAYERDRILLNQPLLKNYDTMRKEEGDEAKLSHPVNCTGEDNKLIEKILFGKIATEVLIPCATEGNDNSMLLFESGPFSLSRAELEAGSFVKPERLCLNNRSLNWHALDGRKEDGRGHICAAFRVAGPYELDQTKRYFVESFVFKESYAGGFAGTVGLYAHVGPYLIQIACSYVMYGSKNDAVVVKSGQNFSYLEQMCPVPAGTTALEVIVYGKFYRGDGFGFDRMNLTLKVYDIE